MNVAMALRGALVMIVVGSVLGLAHNALSPEPVPWKTVPKTTLSLDDLAPEDPVMSAADSSVAEPEVAPDKDPALTISPAADSAGKVDTAPPTGERTDELPPTGERTDEAATRSSGETPAAADPKTPAPGESDRPSNAGEEYADIPEAQFPFEVSLERAKSLYDRGGLLVLDAREHDEYAAGHIKGAESAPFDIMVGDIEWLDRTAADPRPLLVYCNGTDCEISLNLGFEISQNGHPKVLILEGGFHGWAEAGYPTSTGDQP